MSRTNDIWSQVTATIREQLPENEFRVWFEKTDLLRIGPDEVELRAPNRYVARWLEDHYGALIQRAFQDALDFAPRVVFAAGPIQAPATGTGGSGRPDAERVRSYGLECSRGLTLARFIRDESNRFAYSSAAELAANPSTTLSPLFVFSRQSLGKSHLLQAVGNQLAGDHAQLAPAYYTGPQFRRELRQSYRQDDLPRFRAFAQSLPALLMDDVHLLTGSQRSQNEFVRLFDFFLAAGRPVMVTGYGLPHEAGGLLPQMRSRLEGGVLAEIKPAGQDLKRRIIQQKARLKEIALPEDVVFFLSTFSESLKVLDDCLAKIDNYFAAGRQRIDISTVKAILASTETRCVSIDMIQRFTAKYFHITVMDLLSEKKLRVYSYPRQISMYLARQLTRRSYKQIGQAFGNRDHSSVMYAVKTIERAQEEKADVAQDLRHLYRFFTQGVAK